MRRLRRSFEGVIELEAFGVALEVGYDEARLEPLVRAFLPPGWTTPHDTVLAGRLELRREPSGEYTVTLGNRPVVEHAALEVALGRLHAAIRMLIATLAQDLVFVHAGVVAVGQRALVIPGRSFTGKTTLISALVAAGAVYYSDEYAVLAHDGTVLPYPRRLSIRTGDGTPAAHADVSELGGVAGTRPAEVAAVAITSYRRGARWSPQPISRGAGALALIENAVSARNRPQGALDVITQALSGARVLIGARGEAEDAVGSLMQVITA